MGTVDQRRINKKKFKFLTDADRSNSSAENTLVDLNDSKPSHFTPPTSPYRSSQVKKVSFNTTANKIFAPPKKWTNQVSQGSRSGDKGLPPSVRSYGGTYLQRGYSDYIRDKYTPQKAHKNSPKSPKASPEAHSSSPKAHNGTPPSVRSYSRNFYNRGYSEHIRDQYEPKKQPKTESLDPLSTRRNEFLRNVMERKSLSPSLI